VLCPPIPGAFSALGLVGSDLKRDYVQTLFTTTEAADPAALEAAFTALERKGSEMLDRAGVTTGRRRFERSVDARYPRQSYELLVPAPSQPIDQASLKKIALAFHDRHLQTYGHDNRSESVQIVSVRVAAIGTIPPLRIRDAPAPGMDPIKSKRQLWFRTTGAVDAAIYDRRRMPPGLELVGPAVIEALESTILIPPGWQGRMNEDGFVLLTRRQSGARQ
jgi:N-methylhydantoinase A